MHATTTLQNTNTKKVFFSWTRVCRHRKMDVHRVGRMSVSAASIAAREMDKDEDPPLFLSSSGGSFSFARDILASALLPSYTMAISVWVTQPQCFFFLYSGVYILAQGQGTWFSESSMSPWTCCLSLSVNAGGEGHDWMICWTLVLGWYLPKIWLILVTLDYKRWKMPVSQRDIVATRNITRRHTCWKQLAHLYSDQLFRPPQRTRILQLAFLVPAILARYSSGSRFPQSHHPRLQEATSLWSTISCYFQTPFLFKQYATLGSFSLHGNIRRG